MRYQEVPRFPLAFPPGHKGRGQDFGAVLTPHTHSGFLGPQCARGNLHECSLRASHTWQPARSPQCRRTPRKRPSVNRCSPPGKGGGKGLLSAQSSSTGDNDDSPDFKLSVPAAFARCRSPSLYRSALIPGSSQLQPPPSSKQGWGSCKEGGAPPCLIRTDESFVCMLQRDQE